MRRERRRPVQQRLVELDEARGGELAHRPLRRRRGSRRSRSSSVLSVGLRLVEQRLQVRGDGRVRRVDLRLRHHALGDEPGAPHLPRRRVRLDRLVEQRLRVRRLVAFVVAVPAVADEIHEEVAAERRAVRDRDAHRDHARLGVVAVHVDRPASRSPSRGRSRNASSGRRSGSVVKPTWLFTITCSVPPTRYARSRARLNVSATTPSPGNAASPWMQIGTTAISSRDAGASARR